MATLTVPLTLPNGAPEVIKEGFTKKKETRKKKDSDQSGR